jgi:CMP-N-acetylneuraminic acid synthetase
VDRIISIVPARAGSKGIPSKNIADVGGRPLIHWTIEAARGADCFDRIIVSTDGTEIAETARLLDAEVPFMRPRELSGDASRSIDLVTHAVDWLEDNEGYKADVIVLLQPTSPLRTAGDIRQALAMFRAKAGARDTLMSAKRAEIHPSFFFNIDGNGIVEHMFEGMEKKRRQEMAPVYRPNGAIYIGRADYLMSARSFYGIRTLAYVMPEERSLDIDTAWQMTIADFLLRPAAHAVQPSLQ